MKSTKYHNNFCLFLILLAIISIFFGYYFNEIPSGSGGYNGDINFVKKSINIFSDNSVKESILLYSQSSNRPPTIYILHKFLNPFFKDIEIFRLSVFLISLLAPIFLFFSFKEKFKETNKILLILLTSILLLNPYYRNSAFWGLEENYAYICFFLSVFFYEKIKQNKISNYKLKKNLFGLVVFSSLCVYFDQKFILIPLFFFLHLITGNISKSDKTFLTFFYTILALPYLYLITIWKDIFPSDIYKVGKIFYFHHIIYATCILAFYCVPLMLFEDKFSLKKIKNIFFKKEFKIFLIFIFALVVFFLLSYDNNFLDYKNDGGGVIKKLSFMFQDGSITKKIFVYSAFVISSIILFYFIDFSIINFLIIIYFLCISIFARPFYQEYLDPLIIFVYFFLFKKKFQLKFLPVLNLYLFMTFLLLGSNIYYKFFIL